MLNQLVFQANQQNLLKDTKFKNELRLEHR